MGRILMQRVQNDRGTNECTVYVVYDDATDEVTDIEVSNGLGIPVVATATDPRDSQSLSRTVQNKTVGSLPAGARGQLTLKKLRRPAFNSAEARTWTQEQLDARIVVELTAA